MQPIRKLLGNTRTVLLSPDSQLNLIPFAALVDENNNYLVENYSISYLSSGHDLLRLQNQANNRSNPVLIANPDYANPGDASVQIAQNLLTSPPTPMGMRGIGGLGQTAQSRSTGNQRSTDLSQLQFGSLFGSLSGTAQEAEAIAPMLPGVTQLTGSKATENALKQISAPSILHIATHGFFLEDVELVASPDFSNPFSLDRGPIVKVVPRPGASPRPSISNPENPLLRSGIALAGFNPRQSGTEDGVLTALEAAGLNLLGTKLVVLSACETGIGAVNNGEGVYGLRRAFAIAGAESQLISLWKVADIGTKDLMVNYYQRLMNNEGRREALRQTQLEMLRSQKYQHPYYWAAFIPSGDWTSME